MNGSDRAPRISVPRMPPMNGPSDRYPMLAGLREYGGGAKS